MEKFKMDLKKRLYGLVGFNLVAVAFIVLTLIYRTKIAGGSQNLSDMIRGYQFGIFTGIQVMMLKDIVNYTRALRDEGRLKKLYIAENDERSRLIQDKIGGVGLNLSLAVLGIASIIAGFFNQLVFLTLVAVLIFMALMKGSLKLYYRRKF